MLKQMNSSSISRCRIMTLQTRQDLKAENCMRSIRGERPASQTASQPIKHPLSPPTPIGSGDRSGLMIPRSSLTDHVGHSMHIRFSKVQTRHANAGANVISFT